MNQTQTKTFTDFRGVPLAVGDRIIPIVWGDGIPLYLSGTPATIVGLAWSRIRVRFDGEAYGGQWPDFRAIPAGAYVRKIDA